MRFIKSHRFMVFWLAALSVVAWYWVTDPDHGLETIGRIQWLAWLIVVAGPVYLLRRAFFPEARSDVAFRKAIETATGAGLAFLGLCILVGFLFLAFAGRANAAEMPANAKQYIPILQTEVDLHWPDMPLRSALGAQVEQETCVSLKSKRCWSPYAELKTSREYGFGLGQLTITARFNNFETARGLHASLRDWKFEDRYDPARQLRVMVLMDKQGYGQLRYIPGGTERLAMAYAAYNGGLGGLLSDRRQCAMHAGCDPNRWFGHVEKTSLKSRRANHGYGESAFDINRGYVKNIMQVRRVRYLSMDG